MRGVHVYLHLDPYVKETLSSTKTSTMLRLISDGNKKYQSSTHDMK